MERRENNPVLDNRALLKPAVLAAMMVVFALVLVGCGSVTPTPEEPLVQTSVHLDWLHTVDASQFYVAKADEYYAQENLDVEVLPSGYDADGNFIDPVARVLVGEADFGIIDAGHLLTARAEGTPLVAIATIYQRSPVAFVSLAEKNIVRPQDMVGANVQLSSYNRVVYEAMMISQGVDLAQVNAADRTDFSLAPLLNGEADVIDGWITNEVVDLILQGHDINMILPSDYGVVMYPNLIFTTEDMIANNADLVERFLRATVRGMQGAIEDPEKAAELAVGYDKENLNLEHQVECMRQSLPLRNPAGSRPGMMYAKDWETTHQILLDQGLLREPVDVDAAYMLRFVEKAYTD